LRTATSPFKNLPKSRIKFNDTLIESVPDFAKFNEYKKLGKELKDDYARLYDLALTETREDFDSKIADQAAVSKEKIKEVAHATLAIDSEGIRGKVDY